MYIYVYIYIYIYIYMYIYILYNEYMAVLKGIYLKNISGYRRFYLMSCVYRRHNGVAFFLTAVDENYMN